MKTPRIVARIAIALCMLAAGAHAEPHYPSKPVKILVGYAPGGTPDIIARTLAERLGIELGQSFIVENRPGAGGTLATSVAAQSPADGYTLLVADIGQLAIAPYLFKRLNYDPITSFAPVSLAGITPMFLATNAKTSNIKNIQDLISQAKERPGTINYGSSGIGSIHQIAMEVFMARAGFKLTHIPYKGSGQSVPALLGGEVPVLMTALPTVGPYAAKGEVNLLAVTSAQRYPDMPDVPSIAELVDGYDYPSEVGVLAPAGTPQEVLATLAEAIRKALDTDAMRERFKTLGSIPAWSTPAEYARNIRRNLDKYGEAVRLANIQAN